MAPPEKTFPVSELENRIHLYDKDLKERSRKLPKDFSLTRDCALHELVQYSCTTAAEREEQQLQGKVDDPECYPFVRLFRRCKFGNHDFHVETTAWEGRYKWRPSKRQLEERAAKEKEQQSMNGAENANTFASYGSYFWSGK